MCRIGHQACLLGRHWRYAHIHLYARSKGRLAGWAGLILLCIDFRQCLDNFSMCSLHKPDSSMLHCHVSHAQLQQVDGLIDTLFTTSADNINSNHDLHVFAVAHLSSAAHYPNRISGILLLAAFRLAEHVTDHVKTEQPIYICCECLQVCVRVHNVAKTEVWSANICSW